MWANAESSGQLFQLSYSINKIDFERNFILYRPIVSSEENIYFKFCPIAGTQERNGNKIEKIRQRIKLLK